MPERAKPQTESPASVLESVRAGEKRAVAELLNLIEDRRPEKIRESAEHLDALYDASSERSHVIGITGPPGVGKSCLVSRLISHLRGSGKTVGIIAIDPSSRRTGGALLGDRIRFDYDVSDQGVFVRSMANRGDMGGVSDRAFAASIVLRAGFDVVILETVGVGQAEAEVAEMVDTTIFVIQPGSGDTLQFMKAGIMETPDILVVNKSDHQLARRTWTDVRSALESGDASGEGWRPKTLLCSARDDTGVGELLAAAADHHGWLQAQGKLESQRREQALYWITSTLERLYGARGVEGIGGRAAIEQVIEADDSEGPFSIFQSLAEKLEA